MLGLRGPRTVHSQTMIHRSARIAIALWALLALLVPLASADGAMSPAAAGQRCACGMKCGEGCCCMLAHHGGHQAAGHASGAAAAPHGARWESAPAVVSARCGGCQGVASSASGRRSASCDTDGAALAVELPSALHPPVDGAALHAATLASVISPRGPPSFARDLDPQIHL